MLTPKDETIHNWGFFFNRYFLDIFYCFYTLDVNIAFGNQGGLHNIDIPRFCNLGFDIG